jgi:sugar lactone lactonase YvrE
MGDMVADVALHLRAEHAEGPLWDAATKRLWWVDITRQRVHCFDPTTDGDCSWSSPGQPGGVVLDTAGNPVVATPDGLAVLDLTTGKTHLSVPIEHDRPENRANDAKVDSRGRVWVGTMAYDKRAGNAALYRVDGDTTTCLVDGLTISNGPAFDDDDGRFYLADTAVGIVYLFDFDVATGDLGSRRTFLDFQPTGFWPDGMTVDHEGMLWVALGRASAVHRYDRTGRLNAVVELPTSNPTSLAFGGTDGGDLWITTSWYDLDDDDRQRQSLAGAIYQCRPGVTGPAAPRYRRQP